MDGHWITTKYGAHVYITSDGNIYESKGRYYGKSSDKYISKKEYGRFAHLVDSNPGKWRKDKTNTQIIDNKTYYFIYNGFNKYDIIHIRKEK